MKWTKNDIVKYEGAKEYIDTLLIPLAPFQISDEKASDVALDSEVLQILTNEIEKDLSGRLFKLPLYHYLHNTNLQNEVVRLKEWDCSYTEQPFNHKFYLTFHVEWKKYEKELPGSLIWIPGFKSLDIQTKEFQQVLTEQVKDITSLIRSFW